MSEASPEDGRTRDHRNPDLFCNREGCKNYHLKEMPTCRFHGSRVSTSATRQAQNVIATIAANAAASPEVPKVRTQDFPRLAAELVSWHVQLFADLSKDMEQVREAGDMIEHAREYGDIMDRLSGTSRDITKLMQAAAAIGVQVSDPDPRPSTELLVAVLGDVRQRMVQAGACPTCGQPSVEYDLI